MSQPIPNVDSALANFKRHGVLPWLPVSAAGRDAFTDIAHEDVFAVIDAVFAQRHKTLRAALATWAGGTVRAGDLLIFARIDPKARGEQLGIAEFAAITHAAGAFARFAAEAFHPSMQTYPYDALKTRSRGFARLRRVRLAVHRLGPQPKRPAVHGLL